MQGLLGNRHCGLQEEALHISARSVILFLCQETAVFHITAVLSVSDPRVTMAIAQTRALADPGGTHGVTEATLNL